MRYAFTVSLAFLFLASAVAAEIKTFDVTLEESVSRDQSQDAVEAFALQKAKRLAVEKAGTFLSSMAVVEQGRLTQQEITALASGIVKSEVLTSDALLKNGQVWVRVTARVLVDTGVLDKQVTALLEDRSLLLALEAQEQKLRKLEEELSRVQATDDQRLKELNAQAVAMEMEREKRRLFLEEQRLKALGDIAKTELQLLQEERERAAKFEVLRQQQEADRQKELEAIAREQDRIKKAQLENETMARDLARRAELARSRWVAIDDRLSAQRAKDEAESIRAEIASLTARIDRQHEQAEANLTSAYRNQIAATKPMLPGSPGEKDPFETTEEYQKQLADYAHKKAAAEKDAGERVVELVHEERVKLAELTVQTLEQKRDVTKPFVERLEQLQKMVFLIPAKDQESEKIDHELKAEEDTSSGGILRQLQLWLFAQPKNTIQTVEKNDTVKKVDLELHEPEADQSRFPVIISYGDKIFKTYWDYTDREQARLFYQTRAHLMVEPIFQLVSQRESKVSFEFVGVRAGHPGTGEQRDLQVVTPHKFSEIEGLAEIEKRLPEARFYSTNIMKWREFALEGVTFKMVYIPAGEYLRGSPSNEPKRESNETQHRVRISKGFLMGETEVTQGLWQAVMGNNPSHFKACGSDCPVEQVSWNDSQEFIKRLNGLVSGVGFRLPTEAEWEYAARAGTTGPYAGDLDAMGWYDRNSGGETHPVARKSPNSWGLYDMHGNVWEWVQDRCGNIIGNYPSGFMTDPTGPSSGANRVYRGGSWDSLAWYCRSAYRFSLTPDYRGYSLGLRLARTY